MSEEGHEEKRESKNCLRCGLRPFAHSEKVPVGRIGGFPIKALCRVCHAVLLVLEELKKRRAARHGQGR